MIPFHCHSEVPDLKKLGDDQVSHWALTSQPDLLNVVYGISSRIFSAAITYRGLFIYKLGKPFEKNVRWTLGKKELTRTALFDMHKAKLLPKAATAKILRRIFCERIAVTLITEESQVHERIPFRHEFHCQRKIKYTLFSSRIPLPKKD